MYVVSNKTMADSDKACIAGGVPSVELMARAAKGVYDNIEKSGKTYIICGKGNNGGDGFALACLMTDGGFDVSLFYISESISDDALFYKNKLTERGFKKIFPVNECDFDCDLIVDCIFGTGFSGVPKQEYADVIEKINSSRAKVVSVDIPSGLDGTGGRANVAVKADKTVAVQAVKSGLMLGDGKDFSGEIVTVDIGIPIIGEKYIVADDSFIPALFKERKKNCNKGSFGKSLIIGGSLEFPGAPKLAEAGRAALRAGAGLNTLCVPYSLSAAYAENVVESTLFPMADKDGRLVFDKGSIDRAMKGVTAVAIGPGMGGDAEENSKICSYIAQNFDCSCILDADALNAFKENIISLKEKKCSLLLTPHPKEMSRLTGKSVDEILSDPINAAKELAKACDCIVLLKGATTVVSDGERTVLVSNGTPAQAKGGSGDVLTGTICGFAARGISLFDSALAGAYLCAEAAKNAEKEYGDWGVLASDVCKQAKKIVDFYRD